MQARLRLFSVLLFCLVALAASAAEPADDKSPALVMWEKGQEAMLLGQTEQAITCYEQSLQLEPSLARSHLSLAAAYLAKGAEEQAATWMATYLRLQPDHFVARAHYAELLLRLKQSRAAREHFEHFVADIQNQDELASQHLVHCHSRLMEIAEAEEDDYGAHLHRGIGLYWLALQRAQLLEEDVKELSVEGLLCKAAGELTVARLGKPEEARPCWYLYEVWSQLAQSQPAARSLCAAEAAAPYSYLTPTEQRGLELAWRQWSGNRHRK